MQFFLLKLLAAVPVLLLAPASESAVYNVRDLGAAGDGRTDDTAALRKAVEQIAADKGGTLYFPLGDYRCAGNGPTLHFKQISNLTVRFESGARLLIDNLKPDGTGGGHGIQISGPAANIELENVVIEWPVPPKSRSFGDGIRIDGFPADGKAVDNVRLRNCKVVRAPQAGAIFHGCSNVTVRDFRPEYTLADGLHFNACRRVSVNGVFGIENGDDTLAFVTYYSRGGIGAYGGTKPPFTQPGLYGWSNTDSHADNIVTNGGKACGVRISGGKNITVSNVSVTKKWYGVQIDTAKKTEKDRAVGWSYLPSRNITISNANLKECGSGVVVRTLNLDMDAPEELWKPQAIVLRNLNIRSCKTGLQLRDTAEVTVDGLWSDSPASVINSRGRIALRNFVLEKTSLSLLGTQSGNIQKWTRSREGEPFEAKDDLSDLKPGRLSVNDADITAGRLIIRNSAGISIRDLRMYDAPQNAIELEKCNRLELADVRFSGTAAKSPLLLRNCRNLLFTDWFVPEESGLLPEETEVTFRNLRR